MLPEHWQTSVQLPWFFFVAQRSCRRGKTPVYALLFVLLFGVALVGWSTHVSRMLGKKSSYFSLYISQYCLMHRESVHKELQAVISGSM